MSSSTLKIGMLFGSCSDFDLRFGVAVEGLDKSLLISLIRSIIVIRGSEGQFFVFP
jgi:hypothetical protein